MSSTYCIMCCAFVFLRFVFPMFQFFWIVPVLIASSVFSDVYYLCCILCFTCCFVYPYCDFILHGRSRRFSWWVFYKKQELLIICEHLCSPPRFLGWGPCCSSFYLLVLSYYVSLRSDFRVVISVTITTDVTVKEVNHIRRFAIDIAKDLMLLSCRLDMEHLRVLQLETALATLVTTWFTLADRR
jgi:hypothetical protein